MLTALIAPVTGLIVSASAGVAIESAVKIITPPTVKALTGFGIKVGTTIVAGIVASKLASYVTENVESIVAQVKSEAEVTTPDTEN